MRGAALAILVLSLCALCAAQKVHFSPSQEADLLQRTRSVPQTDHERAEQIKAWFSRAGCKGNFLSEEPVQGSDVPNIVCRMRGSSENTIVIGAHYDHATSASRPFDDWTGALLLPSLYECLHTRRRRHTIVFVAFADEGNQLAGSQAFISRLSATELSRVKAMVNLDTLGLSPTKIWSAHSDKDLVQALIKMVYAMKLPASQIDLGRAGPSDSDPFLSRRIPQITIHSISQANLASGMATPFRPEVFYDSYRLICGFIAYLDEEQKLRPAD
ncbi:MAG TPA: M28 family peptidase [Candidatus Angelobacter sp.]|nr:M28 family peptidase [Candidatus Angelobacter sp.]